MTDTPETHDTRSDDGTNVAYQVTGDRPLALVGDQRRGLPCSTRAMAPSA